MSTATPRRLDELVALPGTSAGAVLLRNAVAAGLPSSRDENWKYANLRALDRQVFSPLAAPAEASLAAAGTALPAPLEGFARIVFVDGWYSESLSGAPLPEGAALLTGDALADAAPKISVATSTFQPAVPGAPQLAVPADLRLAQINAALSQQGLRLSIAPGRSASIEVIFIAAADAAAAASHPALQVEVAESATLALVERHLGAGDAATFSNADVCIHVAQRARLNHNRMQQLGPRSRHFETLRLDADEQSECEFITVASGAASARSTALLRLQGREAALAWNAVALADRAQVNDAFVRVEHLGRGVRTSQLFRGIAAGRSRVAFNGHMVVREGAIGAASDQSLKALLAGGEAEADLRPQLEIYVDEVRASHGATIGKLDEQMLFYLLSRGIGRPTAEALLKWAFVADVVARIRIPALRRQAETAMAEQLRAVVDVGELR